MLRWLKKHPGILCRDVRRVRRSFILMNNAMIMIIPGFFHTTLQPADHIHMFQLEAPTLKVFQPHFQIVQFF